MEVSLKKISGCKFEATNSQGNVAVIDGPPALGGLDQGVRPMEMVLMALASCSAMDVIHIMNKSRKNLENLEIKVEGTRDAEAIPSVFTDIHMHFTASGDFNLTKLEKTVDLSVTKYCSVAHMLAHSVNITFSCSLS